MDKNNIEKFQDLHDLKHSAWLNRPAYEEAEYVYQERLAKESLTPLAGEVAKARQRLIESRDTFKEATSTNINPSVDPDTLKFLEKNIVEFDKAIQSILSKLNALDIRVSSIEKGVSSSKPAPAPPKAAAPQKEEEEDDGVDLFGSDSEAEDEAVTKLKEERLAAYHAKKSTKPTLIAKSSILLDVKPWDDETDMKELEAGVRKIQMDGLIWGVSKLVPLAYGIHKLQITCVVEDEKVSIDTLTELIESNEDFVQSVDIFAFNKI